MITFDPAELYDRLLDRTDEVIAMFRREYPALDLAIGEEVFHELREGTQPNTYAVTFVLPSIKGCLLASNRADLMIQALLNIGTTALESFSIVCPVFDEALNDYTEQVFFTYNFKENN